MITSIGAGFLSRLFQSIKGNKKAFKMEKRKNIGWKKASIESQPRLK